MRDRDRRSIREFMESEAKEFAAEQEKRNRPIREAEKQLKQVHRELHSVQKKQVETGTDPDLFVDPQTLGITMPQEDADRYNTEQCKLYVQNHPDYFNSDSNNRVLTDYLMIRNGVQILSVLTLEKAVQRLNEFRLLEPAPVVEEIPYAPVVTFDNAEQTEKQNYQIGIDPATGEEKRYTLFQINKMSSEQYRRAFRVTKAQLNPSGRNWK